MKSSIQSVLACVGTVLVLGSSAHAEGTAIRPIVGGNNVAASDTIAKRTVGLFFVETNGDEGICTGSILDNSHILTAAHCVKDFQVGAVVFANDKMIELIQATANGGIAAVPQLRLMTAVKTEPGYSGQTGGNAEFNDLAVVTFSGGLPVGYEPAKFLSKAAALQVLVRSAPVTLAGYGITSAPTPVASPAPAPNPNTPPVDDGSGTLRSVGVQFGAFSPNQIDMIVAGSTGHDACSGDSGGPSMVTVSGEVYVVGVASRSDCVRTSIYTFVNAETISGL